MGTTAQKLQAILDSKADIKSAIESKDVEVGNAPLDAHLVAADAAVAYALEQGISFAGRRGTAPVAFELRPVLVQDRKILLEFFF